MLGGVLVGCTLSTSVFSVARADDAPGAAAGDLATVPSEPAVLPPAPAVCDPNTDAACQPCAREEKKKKKKKKQKVQASCCDPKKNSSCVDQRVKAIGVPVPIYNPQLDFALGALGMVTYHPIKKDKVSPPWSTMLFGMYATNASWLVIARQEAF